MKLADLAHVASGRLIGSDVEVDNLATDTRTLKAGDLFFALKGENFDGHVFIQQAVESGVAALVVEREVPNSQVSQLVVSDTTLALGAIAAFKRRAFKGPLVAITGSCGKTSVKGLVKSIFDQRGEVVATIGNLNNHIGVPLTLNRLNPQTEFAVIEMGASGGGEIKYLAHMAEPSVAVVNNVRPAHVLGFGGIDAIAHEKGQIYSALNAGGVAVINLDDVYSRDYIAQTRHLTQLGFTRAAENVSVDFPFLTAKNVVRQIGGNYHFDLVYGDEIKAVHLNVLGEHFVSNALAAAACALAAGVHLSQIATGLEHYAGEKGRMQLIAPLMPEQKATLINDAYNANPASVRAAIDYLSHQSQGERVLVFGDMGELGESEVEEHKAIGLYAAQHQVDLLISTGKLSALASEEFLANGEGKALAFDSVDDAIPEIYKKLSGQNTVLLKGSRSSHVDRAIQLLEEKIKRQGSC